VFSILKLKPEDVDSIEKRSKFTVGILGCGQKGILYANAFAEAGYKVLCTDANASVIKKVARGKLAYSEPEVEAKLKSQIIKGQISITSDLRKTVSQSDIVIIAFTSKITEQKKIDITQTVNACKHVGAALRQEVLVIYGGIAGFGLTENTIKETLENTSGLKAGQEFGLVYNPILTTKIPIANQDLKVAASDIISLNAASTIFKTIARNVTLINDLKTAEIATLFTLAQQDIFGALADELVIFCEKAKINYFEIIKLQSTKDQSLCPTIGETESKNEAYLLLESAENLNAKLRLPTLARQINGDIIKYSVKLTQDALRACSKTLRRARVTVLGSTNPEAASSIFADMIKQKGAKVHLYDPINKKDSANPGLLKSSLNEAVEGADCIVIMSQVSFNQSNLKKIKPLTKTPAVIVDLIGKFEPSQVETEGFLYRGLGRGNEAK
jgi:UDP-N-acetyl-D-mannosaminuronic acid dehydrogenase